MICVLLQLSTHFLLHHPSSKTSVDHPLPVFFPAVAASMYVAFLFFKCKQRRKGSYNVHARHQSKQQSPDSNAELGTSSVHSSFRDITVQYQRERMLVGMLGNTGDLDQGEEPCEPEPGLRWSRSEGGESSSSCGLILETVPELHTATDQIQHTL